MSINNIIFKLKIFVFLMSFPCSCISRRSTGWLVAFVLCLRPLTTGASYFMHVCASPACPRSP